MLIRGARQVGKTHAVRVLGQEFEDLLEINFEKEKPVHHFFKNSLNPKIINEKLSAYFGKSIIPKKTLLFFDEIQACPEALQSLRFYHEEIPELHVIAAGSLLEFSLEEIPSFGVGRISSLYLYPMSFGEFLEAVHDKSLYQQALKSNDQTPIDPALHERLLERLRIYQILGGMPAVIQAYSQGSDIPTCQKIIDDLIRTFQDDFAKYKKRSPVIKLKETFESVAHQAGQKFKYAHVSVSGTSQGYSEALQLLVQAGLVHKIYHTDARGIPLGAQMEPKKFKAIPMDCGLYQRLLGLNISEHMVLSHEELIHKGSLAEIFVGLELIANIPAHTQAQLYYWHREAKASNAEVDYVLSNQGIIPIEVKAGLKGQMQSLFIFLKERNLPYGIRLSHENYATYDKVRVMPIYTAGKLVI